MTPQNAESRPRDEAADSATTADLIRDAIASGDYLLAIEAGVRKGIIDAFGSVDIAEAIRQGVDCAFPWPSQIRDAIWGATFTALGGEE